jgi:hypothetical protein
MRDRAGLEAEAVEDIGETGKVRSPRARRASPRRRRRTRAGRELGGGSEETRRKAS